MQLEACVKRITEYMFDPLTMLILLISLVAISCGGILAVVVIL